MYGSVPVFVLLLLAAFDLVCLLLVVIVALNPRDLRDRLLDNLCRGPRRGVLSFVFGIVPGSVSPEAVVFLSTIIAAVGVLTASPVLVRLLLTA